MKMTRGSGSTNAGMKDMTSFAKRPPLKKGRVANDVASTKPRSAIMPPPTSDTSVRYQSKFGATTSPSNSIPHYTGQPISRSSGKAMGHPSATPRCK